MLQYFYIKNDLIIMYQTYFILDKFHSYCQVTKQFEEIPLVQSKLINLIKREFNLSF